MAECECGGPDWVLICPRGCGCICWEDDDGVTVCVSYCEGEDLPSPTDPSGNRAIGSLGAFAINGAKGRGIPRIAPERAVRMSMHDLPLAVLATAVSRLTGGEVWAPIRRSGERLSTSHDGRMSDVCGQLGLQIGRYDPGRTDQT